MKYAEFNIENRIIEFHNTMIGFEKIIINNKTVSKKYSFSGATHQLPYTDCYLESKYVQFGNRKIELSLIKEGNTIDKKTVATDLKQRFFWIIIGVLSGIGTYRFLNYIVQFTN